VAIGHTKENPKVPLALRPSAPTARAKAANANLTKGMLKKKATRLQNPATTRKVVLPHPDQAATGPILPTGTLQAGAAVRVLPDQARITRRYPSNAPSPRRING